MSLRTQIASLLIGLSIAFVTTTYAVHVMVVMPTFAELEIRSAEKDISRCTEAIKHDLESLSTTAADWATWDDTCGYIQGKNESFATTNLVEQTFSNAHLNLLCVLDTNRRIVWGESRDMVTLKEIEVPDLFAMLQEESNPVTTHDNIDDARQGIVLTSKGPMLIASRPIITTKREGPILGSMVMGRFLNDQEIESLATRTHVSISLWTVTQANMPVEAQQCLKRCSENDEKLYEVVDAKILHAYATLKDVYGKPALLMRIRVPRDETRLGSISAVIATGCSLAGCIFTLVAMGFVLQRRVVGPLQQVAAHAVRVGQRGDMTARLNFTQQDEIGTLAREFDGMVQRLSDTRREVQDSNHRAMEQLHEQAYHDALTGLPNRAAILRTIQNVIDREDGSHFAILFLDCDGFKLINDSLGHDVGDELLKEISYRLRNKLRLADSVMPARLGGDEFVVLLKDLACPADAITVAMRLQQTLSEQYQLGEHTVYSSASIGVVTSEHRSATACDMLRDADLAMYQAKTGGKACFAVFNQNLRDNARNRLRVEIELREAISRDELVLVYQPIVSLETGEMEGVEALLRWMHPERGLISPVEFISIAEESGLIVRIGSWALDEACRQFAEWQHSLPDVARPPCIHVNVSRKQLLSPDLVRVVEQSLARHTVPSECLHLELTESMIMEDPEITIAVLNNLRQLGVKIDIDDFGTGYSSLSCLQEFPIDVLKIDRAFVANLKRVRDFSAVLHAVITLADNLGLQVVAEGIEDAEQLVLLQALGCQYGQGYFFAKPMPADQIGNFAASRLKTTSSEIDVLLASVALGIPTDDFSLTYQCEVQV